MLVKTAGIAIKNTRYSDNSFISKIYTRGLGMQTYIIRGVHSKKAAIKPSLLQPLTLLELVAYNKPNNDIQHLKEALPRPPLLDIHFNVVKTTIGLFMAELLNRAVKEEEPNETLFDFAQRTILELDMATDLSMYPLWFCTHLTSYLGFFPHKNFTHEDQFFDLMEGNFSNSEESPNRIEPPFAADLFKVLQSQKPEDIHLAKASRLYLMDKMMQYYTLHIPGFGNLKSLQVLGNLLKEE